MSRTRVLIADDQHGANALAAALRQLDCDVCMVHDGRQAIVAAPTFQPHVAILDVATMPGLDGYDTQLALRRQARSTRTFYAAYTAPCDAAVGDLLCGLGFDYHLRKPGSLDELRALLISAG